MSSSSSKRVKACNKSPLQQQHAACLSSQTHCKSMLAVHVAKHLTPTCFQHVNIHSAELAAHCAG